MKKKTSKKNKERVVPLFGKIDFESMKKIMGDVMGFWQDDHDKEVKLIICSGGGICDPAFMFIDMVKVYGVNLTTIGTGGVGSMAVPIFAMGNKRLITRHTDFYFHDMGFTPDKEERLSISELERRSKNLTVSQRWYAEIIEERTNGKFKAEEVLRLMKKESYLYPDTLLKSGLAHEMI